MNLFIDIETVPQQPEEQCKAEIAETIEAPANMKKPETIAEWHSGAGKYAGAKDALIEEKYRSTSFDGAKGEIISIAWAVDDGEVKSLSRKLDESETDFLTVALSGISASVINDNSHSAAIHFIGHYISGFDLKFMFHRCVIIGVKPPFLIPFDGRHGNQFYDTMIGWCGYKDRISQENLCKALGIEGKPSDIDGSKVWEFVKAGKIEEVEAYNRDDVEKVRQIYNRLTFKGA